MSGSLAIKGIREGLLITLGGNTWAEALDEMLAHIDSKGDFFLGARIALQLGTLEPRAADLAEARSKLAKRGLTLWAALTEVPTVARSAKRLGLATVLPAPPDGPRYIELAGSGATLVRGTLHSGDRIEGAGHVVILGDVDPGAEIIAAGDIIVWGVLSGAVHAGATGDDSALVCALALSPTHLDIAGHAAAPLPRSPLQPMTARLEDGAVMVEAWIPTDGKAHT